MEEATIILTKKEAQALVNLIDIAVKTKGLEVAETGVYLFKKLEDGFKPKKDESIEKTN